MHWALCSGRVITASSGHVASWVGTTAPPFPRGFGCPWSGTIGISRSCPEREENPMHFADRLAEAVRAKGNPVCVGLDPRWESLPLAIRQRHGGDSLEA